MASLFAMIEVVQAQQQQQQLQHSTTQPEVAPQAMDTLTAPAASEATPEAAPEAAPEALSRGAVNVLAQRPHQRTQDGARLMASELSARCAFFAGMPLEVLTLLCSRSLEQILVPEGDAVFVQGAVADSMLVLLSGSLEVLKQELHPHTEPLRPPGEALSTAAGSWGSSSWGSASTSTSSSLPGSRRATVEQQVQAFARASAPAAGSSVGPDVTSAQTRRLSAEQHQAQFGRLGSSSSSRRLSTVSSSMALSRRVTGEQLVQQQLANSEVVKRLLAGDSIGAAALVNHQQRRPVSAVAAPGSGPALLVMLDRACFARLQAHAAAKQPVAAAAVQAVLAAACWSLLGTTTQGRSADDAEALAELFAGLKVRLACWPDSMHVHTP